MTKFVFLSSYDSYPINQSEAESRFWAERSSILVKNTDQAIGIFRGASDGNCPGKSPFVYEMKLTDSAPSHLVYEAVPVRCLGMIFPDHAPVNQRARRMPPLSPIRERGSFKEKLKRYERLRENVHCFKLYRKYALEANPAAMKTLRLRGVTANNPGFEFESIVLDQLDGWLWRKGSVNLNILTNLKTFITF